MTVTTQAPQVLSGKVAIVTGAGGGIGREEALALAAHGARVVVNSLSESCEAVAEEIRGLGGEAMAHRASVGEPADADGLVAAAMERYGRLDILLNNAGVSLHRLLEDIETAELDSLFATNVASHFNTLRRAVPIMKAQGGGRLINTSSGAWRGSRGIVAYGASKAAIVGLTYGAAWELRGFGVTCNAICPFGMTRGVQRGIAAYSHQVDSGLGADAVLATMKDFPGPQYAAPLVVYLASDAAANVTGCIFRSGGGRISLFSHPFETNPIQKDISSGENWTFEELADRIPAEVLNGQRPWWVEDEERG